MHRVLYCKWLGGVSVRAPSLMITETDTKMDT